MTPEPPPSRWEILQAKAHLPEVQAIIRREIMRGEIRVAPTPGGGIRIIPIDDDISIDDDSPMEELEQLAADEPARDHVGSQEEDRKVPIPISRRRAR